MSQSIVELVAKAIDPSTMNTKCRVPNCIECEGNKDIIRKQAKAAIEALREPTDEMLLATQVLPYKDIMANKKIYKQMIEAALNEK